MEIHLHINGQKIGPLTIYEVRERLRSGKINADCMVWIKGMEEWMPLRDCDPFKESLEVTLADADHETIVVTQQEREKIDQIYGFGKINEARPWVRLWARIIDFPILILPGLTFLRFYLGKEEFDTYLGPKALQNLLEGNQTSQLSFETYVKINLAFCISWVITETLILRCFSTTLGKWILNTKISDSKGEKIKTKSALIRSFHVCFRGCGLTIFPFVLICPIISYVSLTKKNTTSWDSAHKIKVSHGNLTVTRIMGAALTILIIQNILGLLFWSMESPFSASP